MLKRTVIQNSRQEWLNKLRLLETRTQASTLQLMNESYLEAAYLGPEPPAPWYRPQRAPTTAELN